MLFVYFCSVISYKISFELRPYTRHQLPDYFHFKSNGKYSIEIDTSNLYQFPTEIDFFVCKKGEFRKFFKKNHYNCSIYKNIQIISNESPYQLTGTIPQKGSYQLLIYSIRNVNNSLISISLRNPNSYLDSYKIPCLYWEPLCLCIILLFVIFWFINSLLYRCGNLKLCEQNFHSVLTKSYFIIILTSIFLICELWRTDRQDKPQPFRNLTIASLFFQYLIVSYSILLSSNGLSIITDQLKFRVKMVSFVFSFLVSLPPILIEYTNVSKSNWRYFFIILEIFSFIIFYSLMFNFSDDSKTEIAAHLYVIGKKGIHPITTPIYKKYVLFKDVYGCLKLITLTTAFFALIFLIFNCPFVVRLIVHDIIIIMYVISLGCYYRYRKGMKKGYMKVDDIDDGQEPIEISWSDATKINLRTFKMRGENNNNNTEKVEWETGMPLPPPPVLVDEPGFHPHYRQNNQSDDDENVEDNNNENRNENDNDNDGINNINDNESEQKEQDEPIIQNINIE